MAPTGNIGNRRPETFAKNSVQTINSVLIGSLFAVNAVILLSILSLSESGDRIVGTLVWIGIVIGFLLSVSYIFVNRRYSRDLESLLSTVRDFLQNREIRQFPQESIFIENKQLESLFKRAYVQTGIMKKDYADLRAIFQKFIPQDIYRQIGFRGYERIALGNCVPKTLTVMFLDIVGFTTISEKISPERTLLLLNIYFDGIGAIIHEHGGYVDKFLGDGIMVIFENPESDHAILSAMEIQKYVKKFQISALGKQLDIGIGINTGEVIMGTIGTKNRMDATVIGDNVNTASRIQGLTRKFGKNILISEATYRAVGRPETFEFEAIGEERVRGKEMPVKLYSVEEYYRIEI